MDVQFCVSLITLYKEAVLNIDKMWVQLYTDESNHLKITNIVSTDIEVLHHPILLKT